MSSRQSPPHVASLASRYPAEAFGPYAVEPDPPEDWLSEDCVCGQCFGCPDDWHWGDDLPCQCTPDCALPS